MQEEMASSILNCFSALRSILGHFLVPQQERLSTLWGSALEHWLWPVRPSKSVCKPRQKAQTKVVVRDRLQRVTPE